MKNREMGVLLPLFSLPSPYGIGTMGEEAHRFVDKLSMWGVRWWQLLPLGPTSYGDSPYQSFSSFAGNPYFIDLDYLVKDALIDKENADDIYWGDNPEYIDYSALYIGREKVLRIAYLNGYERDLSEVEIFRLENGYWLEDYALFMALKKHFDMKSWLEWPDEKIRRREKDSIFYYSSLLKDDINYYVYIQYLFYKEWNELKEYALKKNVSILGDIPIYTALDSSDVWAFPELFQLDEDLRPRMVSGVPPDYFNADGQLWGNPLYGWDKMKEDDYKWWKRRLRGSARLFDMIRLDHFRGLESYYAIPYGDKNARNGVWKKGPGKDFIATINSSLKDVSFIAEDLGYLTEEVIELLKESKWPGMKLLEFAFSKNEGESYAISDIPVNSVSYTGTHDNETLKGWVENLDNETLEIVLKTIGVERREDIAERLLELTLSSPSFLSVIPIPDLLHKGNEARINTPGTLGGNWKWRLKNMVELEPIGPWLKKHNSNRTN